MKTGFIEPLDPFVAGVIEIYHEGDLYPGPDRRHLLQACLMIEGFSGIYGAQIWAPDLATAQQLIKYAATLPGVIQDICRVCHPDRYGSNRPRWNIHHNGLPAILTPCVIEDWMF